MKRILITGASSGIGAATALHLDRCGMEVFAGVRALDGDDALAGASERLRRISLDVTDADSIAAAIAGVSERWAAAASTGWSTTRASASPARSSCSPPRICGVSST